MSSENPKLSTSNAKLNDSEVRVHQRSTSLEDVFNTVKTLRGPNGCPWDLEQTHKSLVPYAIEETYELAQAIESGDDRHFREELGDVLFQILLHAAMAEERGAFTLENVMDDLNEKLVRRHPHVFSDEVLPDMTAIFKRWDEIKALEKATQPKQAIEVPPLPALQRAGKIGNKTRKLDFDWKTASEVKEKLNEELMEIEDALILGDKDKIEEEMGDYLFTAAQWARHLNLEPETCLRNANEKFLHRFNQMVALVRQDDRHFSELSPAEKEAYWVKIKNLKKN